MELRLGPHLFSIGDFVIYVAGAAASTAMPGIAELPADPELIARFDADHLSLPIAVAAPTAATARACVEAGAALLVGDRFVDVAAQTGAGVLCTDPERAMSAGVRADGVLVAAESVIRAKHLVRAGHAVLVTSAAVEGPDAAPPALAGDAAGQAAAASGRMPADAASLAAVSVYAWLGARVFRVPAADVPATRQALEMVASIRGTRPPAVSRRGLV